MKPKVHKNNVELFVIQPVYKIVKGEQKFVKEAYCRVWMDKHDITPYGEYIGSKGQVVKNRTMIFNRTSGSYYKIAHTLSEINEVLHGNKEDKIGF